MNKTKITIYLAVIALSLFGGVGVVIAAPSVNGISGTLSNGSSMTITGSSFGVNGPNVLFFDDFESGTVGQNIKTGADSATIGQWYSLNTVPVTYSSDLSLSGTKSFKAQASSSVEGQVNGIIKLPSVTEIFISWWFYVPTTAPWSGEGTIQGQNWKTMWLAMNEDYWNNGSDTYVWRSGAVTGSDLSFKNNSGTIAYPNTESVNIPYFTKGRWQRLVWWIRDGSNNDGSSSLWALSNTEMQLVRSFTNANTVVSGVVRTDLSVNGHFIQHPTGTQPVAYYDDVYVATGPGARARVEIGNASTYAASNNFSIATVTSWGDTSITATIRQGSFVNLNDAYLYVIDANGNVNANGYLITPQTDTTPPSAPTGLAVV